MKTGSSVPPQAGLSTSCEIRIDNNLSEITRVADMVDDFAARHQFPDEVVFALNVSLDEIVNNIISYGYEDDPNSLYGPYQGSSASGLYNQVKNG